MHAKCASHSSGNPETCSSSNGGMQAVRRMPVALFIRQLTAALSRKIESALLLIVMLAGLPAHSGVQITPLAKIAFIQGASQLKSLDSTARTSQRCKNIVLSHVKTLTVTRVDMCPRWKQKEF